MKTIWREPLVHFLVLGAAIFLVDSHLNRERAHDDAPTTIVVDRESLSTLLQYRSRAFDPARFREGIDDMSPGDRQRLIQDYVREEALFREAKALELDKNDYVARSRLIQQIEFIMRGIAETQVEITEQEVQHHYESHKSEYSVAPKVTFTHVFFSSERRGAQKAEALARAELEKLNSGGVRFEQAPAHGDRFLYFVNYVDQVPDEVASHFGRSMQTELFAIEPNETRWRGPIQSPYGAHLVLLTHREPAYLPSLDEVRARVEQEVRQAALDARFEESIQSVLNVYDVEVKRDELLGLSGSRGSIKKTLSFDSNRMNVVRPEIGSQHTVR